MHIKDFDPYEFSRKDVDGVPVYYKNLPWAPCIHIYFQIGAGAFADPIGKEGLAHFLEHMIGNGCPSVPSRKAMKEFSRKYMLGTRNAFTSRYRTVYLGMCLPEHFARVFPTMKEYVFQPLLRAEDAEHERKVITEEAWGTYKNPKYLKYFKEVSQNLYPGHERSRIGSPLGWPDTIRAVTQEDLAAFHAEKYVKENLTVFLAGAVTDEHMSLIAETLRDLPSGQKHKKDTGSIGAPLEARFERKGEDIGHITQQLGFCLVRIIQGLSERDMHVGTQTHHLLYEALTERLRIEKSLCYSVGVRMPEYSDYTEVAISVDTSEDKLQVVEEETWKVIREIMNGDWQARFDEVHALTIDQLRSNERLTGSIMQAASEELVSLGKIVPLKEMVEQAQSVTYKDVQELLQRVFVPELCFTEVILPKKD